MSAPGFLAPPASPFLWGADGRRMTPEQVDLQRRQAAQQMASATDTSPVGHWTAGLARAVGGLTGSLQMRRANRAAQENEDARRAIIESLTAGSQMEGGGDPVAAALADPELRQIGVEALKARQPKPVEPVIKQMNNGDYVGLHPLTGEVLFTQKDPNPKPSLTWITADNPDGTKQLIPVGPDGPIIGATGAAGSAALPTAPVGKLTPVSEGGPTPQASGEFRDAFSDFAR